MTSIRGVAAYVSAVALDAQAVGFFKCTSICIPTEFPLFTNGK